MITLDSLRSLAVQLNAEAVRFQEEHNGAINFCSECQADLKAVIGDSSEIIAALSQIKFCRGCQGGS